MRKTKLFKVTSGSPQTNRDFGKTFLLTEMPAMKAERWAIRALLALAHAGVDIDDGARRAGMAGIARAGLKALQSLEFAEARPLLDEMWDCVRIIPDVKNIEFSRTLMRGEVEGDDIEELSTIWDLRQEVFALHTDFFLTGSPSRKA